METFKCIAIHSRSTYWTSKELEEESYVDSDDLARKIQNACNKLDNDGYDIISITPVSSGNISNGNGYIQSESVIITGKKRL